MTWEWQVWRCFDNIRETFEEKGWEYRFAGNGMIPLLGESDEHCLLYFERDAGTGECWFELRDKARHKVVFVQGAENMPTTERAAELLASYGTPLGELRSPHELPLYALPIAPVVPTEKAS